MTLWRQGDVLIQTVIGLPGRCQAENHVVLARGDVTNHSHRVEDPETATLFSIRYRTSESYLHVSAEQARIVHPEHDAIELPAGYYRVWRQREYSESGNRWIAD